MVLAFQGLDPLPGGPVDVRSGSDGGFRFDGLAAGSYRLAAQRVGYEAPAAQSVNVTQEVVVTLEKLAGPTPFHVEAAPQDWSVFDA